MTKERWFCLILILAALAAGVAIGEYRKSNTMTMVVLNGKVYPSPNSGDVLNWATQDGVSTTVKFAGPPNSGKSPCTEDENTPSATCHVKYKTPSLKMYYYDCRTCTDPGYAGPHANGHLGNIGSQVSFGPAPGSTRNGGNTYRGEAYPNGQASAVYYYPSDGSSPSDFLPIPVSTYPQNPTENDQIVFDPPGADWKIVVADNTCKEQANGGIIGSAGSSTCTVLSTAMPQYYCVLYGTNKPGNATLIVNGQMPAGTPPTPSCTY